MWIVLGLAIKTGSYLEPSFLPECASSIFLFVAFWRFPSRRSHIEEAPSLLSFFLSPFFPEIRWLRKYHELVLPHEIYSRILTLSNTFHEHFLKGKWIQVERSSKHQAPHSFLLPILFFYKNERESDTCVWYMFDVCISYDWSSLMHFSCFVGFLHLFLCWLPCIYLVYFLTRWFGVMYYLWYQVDKEGKSRELIWRSIYLVYVQSIKFANSMI